MKRLRLVLAAAFVALLAAPALPAQAAEGAVVVRNVDTLEYPTVKLDVLVNGAAPKVTDFTIRENGTLLPQQRLEVVPLKQTAKPVGTVLVLDTSGSMKSRGALDQAKAAAHSYIDAKGPNDWIAIVAFSSKAILQSDFTQDAGALKAGVDGLAAVGETALWDGLLTGAQLFDKRPDLQPNLVLLSDGADTVSAAPESQAVAALSASKAAVFAVGIASDDFDTAGLNRLVGGSGGTLITSTDPKDLTAQFGRIRTAIENQYQVVYQSTGTGGPLTLELSVGGTTTQIQTRAGTTGAAAQPETVSPASGIFARSEAKFVIFLMALVAAGLLAFALFSIFGEKREQSIDGRLEHYVAARTVTSDGTDASSHAESSFVKRAVELTSKLTQGSGLLAKVESLLEQANLPLRPAEALFFYVAGVLLLGLLALLGAPSLPVGLMALFIVAATPIVVLSQLKKRRIKAFEAQLPDTLNLLAGSLRAGYSFLQGVEAVAQETSDPMARELRRVIAEARLGRPLDEALGDVAARMKSVDFDWSVMAIRIQREVGGNLAELLQTVAETMVERSRLRGEVKTLTAEGRLSSIIMGGLPIALGGFMFMSSPDYIGELFRSAVGWAMVIGSVILGISGFAWLQKIIKIEV